MSFLRTAGVDEEANDNAGAEDTVPLLGTAEARNSSGNESYTAVVVLVSFTVLSFLTYLDRGVISGAMNAIQMDTHFTTTHADGSYTRLSATRSGLLVSAFMVGFMCTSPLFALLGKGQRETASSSSSGEPSENGGGGRQLIALYSYSPKSLILFGMALWCAAVLATAAAPGYTVLLVARCLVGIGEAAYISFTLVWLTAVAPARSRSLFVGIYYATIPFGTAAGMMAGGVLASFYHRPSAAGGGDGGEDPHHGVFWRLLHSWRLAFAAIGCCGACVLCLIARCVPEESYYEKKSHSSDAVTEEESTEAADRPSLREAAMGLVTNACYLYLVLGYACYVFVVGAVAVWSLPLLVQGPLQWGSGKASVVIGLVTGMCGMLGTLLGGLAVDYWARRREEQPEHLSDAEVINATVASDAALEEKTDADTITVYQFFNIAVVTVALPAGLTAVVFAASSMVFISCYVIAVLSLFALTAPINICVLKSVRRPCLRPLAVSCCVLVIHILGDFPSPTVLGMIADWYRKTYDSTYCRSWNTRETCTATETSFSLPSALIYSPLCFINTEAVHCSNNSNSTIVNPNGHYCRWNEEDEACVYVYALRNSFFYIFSVLAAAIPFWIAALYQARKRATPRPSAELAAVFE